MSGSHDEAEERIPQRAMRELLQRTEREYRRRVDALWNDLLRYVSTKIVPGLSLSKAEDDGKRIGLLSPQQLEDVKTIVREHHLAFAVDMLGAKAVPAADLRRLQRVGLVPLHVRDLRVIDLAYLYGRNAGAKRGVPTRAEDVEGEGLDSFIRHVDLDKVETTPVDEYAMDAARTQAGQYIRGIGERLAHDIGVSVLDADSEARRRYIGTVRTALEDAIDRKAEWRKLASTIAHETGDWGRDMHRVAATEMQSAMEEGTARGLAQGRDPKDVRVAKLTAGGACGHCVALYRTKGQGSAPRIFLLSELAANGTNVGRRAKDWRPVVGATHPWCHCTLVEVPPGWAFDEEGRMVPEALVEKSETRAGHVMPYVLDVLERDLVKAGPFIGPKGGKWADAAHTVPWHETTAENSEDLRSHLVGPGKLASVGAEKGRAVENGIAHFKSPHGSSRFVHYENGHPVASLQVVHGHGGPATVANVYTASTHRRKGLASKLLDAAREKHGHVEFSEHLSGSGRAFTESHRMTKADPIIRPHMTHDAIAGDELTIRIADPRMHSLVAQICATAPPALFRRGVGVTLITTDHPRAQNPLDEHDFAYWTGNEIRLSQTLPIERLPRVLRHELGHAPNVYLMRKLGGATAVRAWHDQLWAISKREGWCSDYASMAPIENAAEVTRMFMFERLRLMATCPRQFAFVDRAYDGIFDQPIEIAL